MANTTTSISTFRKRLMFKKNKYKVSAKDARTWSGFFRGREQDITFDSKKEMRRFVQLVFLQKAGEIRDLQLQERFVLADNMIGEKSFKITYIADFTYYEKGGKFIVEDSKGFKTKEYLKKKRMFIAKFPDIVFLET